MGGASDEEMSKGTAEDQSATMASGSGTSSAARVTIDGYAIDLKQPSPILWKPLSSNSWRTRLKRVRDNQSAISSLTPDEPSGSEHPRRYSYSYPDRSPCAGAEVVPKVDAKDLLEIAGCAAQAFKDVKAAIQRHEQARSSSKKGKGSSTAAAEKELADQTPAKKRGRPPKVLTQKRGRPPKNRKESEEDESPEREDSKEREETKSPERKAAKVKEKSRSPERKTPKRKDSAKTSVNDKEKPPKSPERKTPKETKKSKSPLRKSSSKKEKSTSPERKEVNGGKFNLSSIPKRSASSSPERAASVVKDAEVSPKKYRPKQGELNYSAVNVEGWSDEKMFQYFKLREFTIDISDFPHHELKPSTSTQRSGEDSAEKNAKGELPGKDTEQETKEEKGNKDVDIDERKSRKRKRSASSSSSCSCASSAGGRKNKDASDESDSEQNVQTKSTAKKKAHGERPCVECRRWLDDCVLEWKDTLGPSSVWCSRECIDRRVARAHEVLPEGYGALTLLRGDGQLLTTGPTLVNLAEFIYKYPEYEPVLPVTKKKSTVKNDQVSDAKKSAPKVLSKDSDRIRFNVRRAFSDALTKRAKMEKLKSAVKLSKEVAENVEAALFKSCKLNLNSPRYKMWTKIFIENVTDCRNKHFFNRVLTGAISVQKLVTMESDDMRKPEQPGSAEDAAGDEEKTNDGSDTEDPSVSECKENSEEAAKESKSKKVERNGPTGTPASGSEANVLTRGSSKKEAATPTSAKSAKKVDPKSAKRPSRREDSLKSAVSASASMSALDSILGDGARDTTEQHLSHFYDVNCSICLAKQKSLAEAERKEREEKEKQRLEDKRFREMLPVEKVVPYAYTERKPIQDADYRWHNEDQSFDEDVSVIQVKRIRSPERRTRSPEKRIRSPEKRIRSPESTGAACASDDEYAGSYGCAAGDSPVFQDTREEETRAPYPRFDSPLETSWRPTGSRDTLLPWNSPASVWSGQICMNTTTMTTTLSLISNPIAYRMVPKLPPVLRIRGRIVPVIVFDYILETVKNGEHHVVVLRLTRPADLEGEQRYISIYEDMRRKGRYFAVDVPADSCFKDIYLLPLAPGEEPPAMLLPFDGPGLPTHHPAMIMCVMVIYGEGKAREQTLLETSFSRETVLSTSPHDPQLRAYSNVGLKSSSHTSTPKYATTPRDSENTRPELSRPDDSAGRGRQSNEDDKDLRGDYSPRSNPPNVLPETVQSSATETKSLPSQSQTQQQDPQPVSDYGPATPPEPPPIDYAPVGEADNLLPSKFFIMCKEASKEPAKVPSVEEIDTLPDLLLFIQLNSNPREIKDVVARFMMNPSLSDEDRELIRRKVMEKVSSEKRKRARGSEVADDAATTEESKKSGSKNEPQSSDGLMSMDAIDLESLNNLSSFVGAGAQELLKQAGSQMDPSVGQPPSPPPPPPPMPLDDEEKAKEIPDPKSNNNENGVKPVPSSEMLPGPPPVPPVYCDDSSDGESPPDHDAAKGAESTNYSRSSQFQPMNVIPVPPPVPVASAHLELNVPPPPPPPPPPPSVDRSAAGNASASAKQPFTPPPPPPPIFASTPGTNQHTSPTKHPAPVPPPAMFRPHVMMPPGIPPPPPFMGMHGMPVPPMPVPPPMMPGGCGPVPPPPSIPASYMNHGSANKAFFPCPPPSRPSLSQGPPPGARNNAPPFVNNLAAPPAQPAAGEASGRTLPTGDVPSLGRPLTERDLIPRTPTPPPSPKSRQPSSGGRSKNGPRTPSPDQSKKREREAEIERLKRDLEERKKLEMQKKLGQTTLNDQSQGTKDQTEERGLNEGTSTAPAQPPSSSNKKQESDAMDIEGGESEGEHGDNTDSARRPTAAPKGPEWGEWSTPGAPESWNEWSAPATGKSWSEWTNSTTPRIERIQSGPATHIRPPGAPLGPPQPVPPPQFGRGGFPGTPRGVPPPMMGRGRGFLSPNQYDGGYPARGGFFTPPPPIRGAPNLRRGFPSVGGRGEGGFPPPPSYFPGGGRGGFMGGYPAPRGGSPFGPPRGVPPPRGRFGPPM